MGSAMTEGRSQERERDVTEMFRRLLLDAGWNVELEPLVELYRPDLIATSPIGHVYAVEFKSGQGPVHFGALAQAASYRSALSASRKVDAQPVLFAIGGTSGPLEDLARSMDVLMAVEPPDAGDIDVARRFAKQLLDWERS